MLYLGYNNTPNNLLQEEDYSDVLAFGGLKHANAEFMKKVMEPVIGPVSSVRYPAQGLKLDVMSTGLGQYFSKLDPSKTIGVAGQSLGLMTSMKALATCVNMGIDVPKIDTIWGVGSPMDALDIRNGKVYRHFPAVATHMKSVVLGVVGDVITEVVPARNPLQAGRVALRRALRETCSTQTTQQWGSQLGFAYTNTESDLNTLANSGVIGPHTTARLYYQIGDTIIFAEQAATRLAASLGEIGVSTKVMLVEGDDHGSLNDVPDSFWHRENKVYSTGNRLKK